MVQHAPGRVLNDRALSDSHGFEFVNKEETNPPLGASDQNNEPSAIKS